MTDNTLGVRLFETLFGNFDMRRDDDKSRLFTVALRLLADGEPITRAELAAAAGISEADVEHGAAVQDIEYDEQGRIVGWGLTTKPTRHKFMVDDKQFYTWCAPDTLIFPALIGRTANIESSCPTTGTTIRLTVDPGAGIVNLQPATAVVAIVDPDRVDLEAVRATACDLQPFFATPDAARDWQSRYSGMTVLPVEEAHKLIIQPFADAILADNGTSE